MIKYVLIVLFALLISGYYNFSSRPEIPVSRRWLLFVLRFISLGILLLLLISPILYYTQHKNLAPQILVLNDNSASMDTKHGATAKSAYMKPLLSKLKGRFSDAGYDLVEHSFANGLEGDNGSSLLAASLKQLGEKSNLQNLDGVLIASDGWLRDESLAIVQQLGCPFYVLADSSQSPSPDLAITNVRSNRYAWRNEPNTIRAEFSAENYTGPAKAKLLIGNRVVSQQNISLEAGKKNSIDFTQRFNQTGFFTWKVELSTLENETRLSNNTYPGAIEVLADKERIILISDKPAWDNKFTLDAISSNPRWTAESYLNRDGRLYIGEKPIAKLSAENLAAIIVVNNGLLKLDSATAAFVTTSHSNGVGLLYQGIPVAELAQSLPIQRSNVTSSYQGFITPNPAAANYPMLSPLTSAAKDVPPVDYYYVTTSPQSEVLASINNPQNSPAIVAKSIGGTHSLAFATLNLWRWQMQSGDDGYKKMISSSLTWLSNKNTGTYNAIYNNSYFQGEDIRIRLRVEDSIRQSRLDLSPRIVITDKDNKEVLADYMTREGEEYSFKADLKDPGTYSFTIADKDSGKSTKGRFELSNSSLESRDFGYNLPLLSWLAAETNGKLLYASNLDSFTPLPAVKEVLVSRREVSLYKKWYILSLFILAFCVELYLRRRWGLL
jgi:hypothetical protein